MYTMYILPKICIIFTTLTKDDVHSATMPFPQDLATFGTYTT